MQSMPKKNDNVNIYALVIMDMLERAKVGKRKYKTFLQPFNGRDALQDAYEESLDQSMYLKQAIMERDYENNNKTPNRS